MNRSVLLLVCAALVAGCTSHEVVVSHTAPPGVVVSSYGRYHLVVTPTTDADRLHWMIEDAVHRDLRAKGYVPVDRGSADLIVTYQTDIVGGDDEGVKQAIDGSIAARPTTDKNITVTMVDARGGGLVWRGNAKGEVAAGRLTASLTEALTEILEGVPARRL